MKLKNNNGPFRACYHFQCGERQWLEDKFTSDKDVNKMLKAAKNVMAMIDVYDKDGKLVYSKYHQ